MSKDEHYHGLKGWVSDYQAQRKAGNVKDAKQTRDNITAAIKKHKLDATKVWGKDPDQPKDTMKEHKAVSGLAFLVESELEKAQVVIAAKGILDKLQKMAEDLAKMEADDIMPMLDSMRLTFGPELTDSFNDVTTAKIRQTMEAVKGAKEAITHEVGRLENEVNGDMSNDMGMGDDGAGDLDMGDMGGDEADAELGDGLGDIAGEDGADDLAAGAPELDIPTEDGADADLDAAFDDAAADTTAAGRARKESIERNVKALSESKNPDRLVFETFRRTLRESAGDAVKSAKAVANAFAIDFADVVAIVKEGKTFKDEKGKTDKNKDRAQDRKDKKRDRPTDLDEAKEVEEGKTYKDGSGKADKPYKDYSKERAQKKQERPSPLDEASFNTDHKGKAAPFGKRKPDPTAKVPNNFDDMKAKKKPPVDEGKTFKDEKGKTDKNKDYSQARKDKNRDRDRDVQDAE